MRSFIKYSITALTLGIVFTSLSYNLDVIINLLKILTSHIVFKYIAMTFFYFFLFLFIKKKLIGYSSIIIVSLVIIAPILVDIIVVLNNSRMYPLRFPFSSIFPILGVLLALIYTQKSKFIFKLSIVGVTIFIFFTHIFIIPRLVYYSFEKSYATTKSTPNIFDFKFYTINGEAVILRDTNQVKVSIIETYFKGCAPCERKSKDLKIIKDSINNPQLKIIFICDGTITSFNDFIEHANMNIEPGFTFLYDKDSVLYNQFNLHSYPFEFFTLNNKVVGTIDGYDNTISGFYIKTKTERIKKILYD